MNPFVKATKSRAKLRMALFGPSGSGKTFTALTLASVFGKVAVIDTERGSASKYADQFDFDVLELTEFHPQKYIDAIKAAESAGYDVIVIDSLSHAWSGTGGVLEQVDRAAKRSQSNNTYTAWRDVTPLHNALIEAMIGSPIHVIATMRSKTEYVLETNERGKQAPRKIGLAPVQRDGMEYEFDVCGEMNQENELIISKSRCASINNAVIARPGRDLAHTLLQWVTDGAERHWATNGGGQRVAAKMAELGITWAAVADKMQPDTVLARMSDTTLTEAEFTQRLIDLAAVLNAPAEPKKPVYGAGSGGASH